MLAFAFQHPDIEPIPAPGGQWFASVSVASQAGLIGGYSWRHPSPVATRHEAIRSAKRHLKALGATGQGQCDGTGQHAKTD